MTKTNCPAGCGKRFIDAQSAENHMKDAHPVWAPKLKGWTTPYGFADYQVPVTYAQACADMKVLYDAVKDKFK
jgi:hypothetical protein